MKNKDKDLIYFQVLKKIFYIIVFVNIMNFKDNVFKKCNLYLNDVLE